MVNTTLKMLKEQQNIEDFHCNKEFTKIDFVESIVKRKETIM